MKISFYILILTIFFNSSCQNQSERKPENKFDYLKLRPVDTNCTSWDSTLTYGKVQQDYNALKLRDFDELLKALNIKPLINENAGVQAYRITISSDSRIWWNTSPQSFTVVNNQGQVFCEIANLIDSSDTDFQQSGSQLFTFESNLKDFIQLDSALSLNEVWSSYSFDSNKGWRIFDNDVFFVEMLSNSNYKLIVRENGELQYEQILVPFLKAINYNDSIIIELNKMIEFGKVRGY